MQSIIFRLLSADPCLVLYSKFHKQTPTCHPEPVELIINSEYSKFIKEITSSLNHIHPRYLLSCKVARLVFSPISHPITPYDISAGTSFLPHISLYASVASRSFAFLSYRHAFNWFSGWCSVLSFALTKLPLELRFPETITEFGPGAGFLPLILSSFFPGVTYRLYDLPIMTKLQATLYGYLSRLGYCLPLTNLAFVSRPSDLRSSDSSGVSYFLAFWSFTESPLELRSDFLEHFKHTDVLLFVSNSDIFGVDNNAYFSQLSELLPRHSYESHSLPLAPTYTGYLSRHRLHLFYVS